MISDLHLTNFRSYTDQRFTFGPMTVIIGPNGRGKTNVIEALYLLSTGRSFRTNRDSELIHFNQPFARLVSDPLEMTIIGGERTKKQVRIHGKPVRLLELLGENPSVLFAPSSLDLIDGGPAARRQFFDILLCQTDRKYARALLDYQRIVRQRSELLHQIQKQTQNTEALGMWDDLLVQAGLPVMHMRAEMAKSVHEQINGWYQHLVPQRNETLEVGYLSSVEKRQHVPEVELETLFHERLRERRVAEIQAGRTLIGPHRDDMVVLLNRRSVANYGSRGQIRSAVVALKLFEYHYITEHLGKSPTLLFDDVFSEFDPARRKAILSIAPAAQVIFTATDLKHVGRLPSRAEVINLDQTT